MLWRMTQRSRILAAGGILVAHLHLVGGLHAIDEEIEDLVVAPVLESGLIGGETQGEVGVDDLEDGLGDEATEVGIEAILEELGHRVLDDVDDEGVGILGLEDVVAVAVDDRPLVVHDVVVFENVLPREIVAGLDLLLGVLDGLVEPRVLEFLAFLEAEPLHHLGHALGRAELHHEVVLEGDVEDGHAGSP